MGNYLSSFSTQIVYCALFGATSGAYMGLTPVITIDLFGLGNFVKAYGFQVFAYGIGTLIGPPLIGKCTKIYMKEICMIHQITIQVHYVIQVEVIIAGFSLLVAL